MSGTASRPDDYTGTLPALARQADGDRAVADIAFTIKGDDRDEPDETIVLAAAVGDRTFTATLTIADDDETPATVPGRPGLSVTKPPRSGFQIHLNITAPASDGGSPITGYQCQVRLVSSTQWTDALHSVCRTGGDLFNPAGVFSADEDSILRVRARNAVGPGPWAHARLNRHGPQDNRAPSFTEGSSTTRTIAENAPVGSDVGAPVTATDPDIGGTGDPDDALAYRLSGADAGAFDIDAATGQIATRTAFDRTMKIDYAVTVRVADLFGGSDTIAVAIAVTEAIPNTPATGKPAVSGIAEEGQELRADVSGIMDADGLTDPVWDYRWIRVAPGGAETEIAGTEGAGATYIVTSDDVGGTLRVRVRFRDDRGNDEELTSDPTATVLANAPPAFTSDAVFRVPENSTEAGTVVAEDPDSQDAVAYAITGGADRGRFSITSPGGVLSFKDEDVPDFEAPADVESTSPANAAGNNEYVVTVTATSGTGHRVMSAAQDITVTVTNENEAPGALAAPTFGTKTLASLVVNWQAPATNTGPAITDYDVRYYAGSADPANEADWIELDDTTSSTALTATIPGLTAGTAYRVQVRAENAEGAGTWSQSGAATTTLASLAIDSPRVAEGDSGSAMLTFTVTLSPASGQQVTVAWADAGTGTAASGTDYATLDGGTLTFAPGDTSRTIAVTVTGDRVDEPDETVVLTLSNAVNATFAGGVSTLTGTGTITDDDDTPVVTLVLSPDTVSENGGVSTVTATLDRASSETTTVTVSAAAVAPAVSGDFTLSTNTELSIAAGATTSTGAVTLTGVDNSLDAPDKTVTVSATAANSQGATAPADVTLTLTDDDGASSLSIDSPSVAEGDSGTTTMTFTVTLAPASGHQVTVDWADAGTGTATSGTDYTALTSGTLTFAPGDTSKTIEVTLAGDTVDEPDETVLVALSNPANAAFAGGVGTLTGTGTITDDDATPVVTLSLSHASISENGGMSTVTATLDRASSEATTVTVSAAAVAPAVSGDFTLSANKELSIAAGATTSTGTVTVTGVDNSLDAPDRTVTVSATAANSQGVTAPRT